MPKTERDTVLFFEEIKLKFIFHLKNADCCYYSGNSNLNIQYQTVLLTYLFLSQPSDQEKTTGAILSYFLQTHLTGLKKKRTANLPALPCFVTNYEPI
jgi:hypothetical protein